MERDRPRLRASRARYRRRRDLRGRDEARLAIRSSILFDNRANVEDDGPDDLFDLEEVVLTDPRYGFEQNEVVDPMLSDPTNPGQPGLGPMGGSPALEDGETPADPFFTPETFRGGVGGFDLWYNWTEF